MRRDLGLPHLSSPSAVQPQPGRGRRMLPFACGQAPQGAPGTAPLSTPASRPRGLFAVRPPLGGLPQLRPHWHGEAACCPGLGRLLKRRPLPSARRAAPAGTYSWLAAVAWCGAPSEATANSVHLASNLASGPSQWCTDWRGVGLEQCGGHTQPADRWQLTPQPCLYLGRRP